MKDHSDDEPVLIRIQHQWAEARLKRDSSFAPKIEADDFTVGNYVWTDTFVKQNGEWKAAA